VDRYGRGSEVKRRVNYLLLNPETNIIACASLLRSQIVVEGQVGDFASLEQFDGFGGCVSPLPPLWSWSFIIKVKFYGFEVKDR